MNPPAADDPLHTTAGPGSHWSTTNLAEAYPGVMTPLDWTLVGPATERATRRALGAIGALGSDEEDVPADPDKRIFGVFHGRIASRLDFFYRLGGLMPGTTPDAVVEQIFGSVPSGMQTETSKRRYPVIAGKFPVTFVRIPRRSLAMRERTRAWWVSEIAAMPQRSWPAALAAFGEAVERMTDNLTVDGTALLAGSQPIYDQFSRLAEATGVDAGALMSGYGSHEEAAVVRDIWKCSRGQLDIEVIVARYGYHGPREGIPSRKVWREDRKPLVDLVAGFERLDDDRDPELVEREKREKRLEAERELLRQLPAHRRVSARLVLRLAATYMPLRGKAARTQAIDVVRAAARRLGECLVEQGRFDDPEDVYFLTADELRQGPPADAAELVAARRARYEQCLELQLPSTWQGQPDVEAGASGAGAAGEQEVETLNGVGASAGTIEGEVRVLSDPEDADALDGGEVLVAHTTDPSWAPAMYLASALVVDIGGLMSHAAIVARELGVPCVMGTGNGTTALRSGDTVRVDGKSGTVEVLSRKQSTIEETG